MKRPLSRLLSVSATVVMLGWTTPWRRLNRRRQHRHPPQPRLPPRLHQRRRRSRRHRRSRRRRPHQGHRTGPACIGANGRRWRGIGRISDLHVAESRFLQLDHVRRAPQRRHRERVVLRTGGMTPKELKATLELPVELRFGSLTVKQGDDTITQIDLPPRRPIRPGLPETPARRNHDADTDTDTETGRRRASA